MPKGIPKNGINKGQFKKGDKFWQGKTRSDEDKQKMSKPKTKKYIDLEIEDTCSFCKNVYTKVIHNQLYCKTCVPTGTKGGELIRKYNISYPQYLEMLNINNGICEICKLYKADDIDHCHISGYLRGLLCHNCNMMLGHAKDNLETLSNAIKYLENSSLQNYGK